jgi:uncharacterized protein with HEPN domain
MPLYRSCVRDCAFTHHRTVGHPEVPWRQVIALRHRIVNAYFDLDWQILWDAATDEIPELQRQVLNILTTAFSESKPD